MKKMTYKLKAEKYRKYIIVIAITLLTLQIAFSTSRNIKLKKSISILISAEIKEKKINNLLNENIKNIFVIQSSLEQKKIISSNNLVISNSLKDGEKVFCLIKSEMCSSCVLSVIQDLSILGKSIGNDKIILLFDKKIIKNKYNIDSYGFRSIKVNTIFPEFENTIRSPFIFILNKKFDILVPFTSDWFPEQYEDFFRIVLPSHFK